MTENETAAYQRLEALQARLARELGANSRGIRDLANVPITKELLADIKTCISSEDHLAIGSGLYVLKGVMRGTGEVKPLATRVYDVLPYDFYKFLISRIEQLLDHPFNPVVYDAMDWYGQFWDRYPDYRERMLKFLASDDLGRREGAIKYYLTYAKPGEVEPLLHFRNDDYAGETRPLGDWEFELRNKALDLIEKQLDRTFPRIQRNEPYAPGGKGARVIWYDWAPFLEWWLKNGGSDAALQASSSVR
jgi:hypothetical protein